MPQIKSHVFDRGTFPALVTGGLTAFLQDGKSPQLEYLTNLLIREQCKQVIIEDHYIDRDFMEDHSAFYARCVYPPPNHCRRAHYFRKEFDVGSLKEVSLSEPNAYLGYSVLRPLASAPIGRTAIASPQCPEETGFLTRYPATRQYEAHIQGATLRVNSLAFQQQDRAVSACATTALWTSLSRLQAMERMSTYTPAAITTMAASAPSAGRVFPSDGLSIEQMCRVVQQIGAAPVILSCEQSSDSAVSYIHAALDSGLAPILMIADIDNEERWHAVVAAGYHERQVTPNPTPAGIEIVNQSLGIKKLFVHDDRIGPFVPAHVKDIVFSEGVTEKARGLALELESDHGCKHWHVKNIIVPTYHKVRFSFPELIMTEMLLAKRMRDSLNEGLSVQVCLRRRIEPALTYIGELERRETRMSTGKPLSRYVGIITYSIGADHTDLVFDTTAAPGDAKLLDVVGWGEPGEAGDKLRRFVRRLNNENV